MFEQHSTSVSFLVLVSHCVFNLKFLPPFRINFDLLLEFCLESVGQWFSTGVPRTFAKGSAADQ